MDLQFKPSLKSRRQYVCDDCFAEPLCPQIKDKIWLQISTKQGLLCIDCFEHRMKRRLRLSDLENCLWTNSIKSLIKRREQGLLDD